MIYSIKGLLMHKSPTYVVIESYGIGYEVNITMSTFEKLPENNQEVFLNTTFIVREDSQTLYGFYSNDEKKVFTKLISVSGIGPKSAIGILSSINASELTSAILKEDVIYLKKLPGIGKKTAERLILELKDKLEDIQGDIKSNIGSEQSAITEEAILALTSLGYSKKIAEKSVKKAFEENKKEDISSEKLIKLALKYTLK